jgi:branched-chain amino acid transport system ATP-binding protein
MLTLDGLDAGYGDTHVLRNVSLVVPDGSVVSLLGPNGAGKTTLLRTASGLLRPSSGRILLDGDDVTRLPPHQLVARGVCHIPEGRGIFRTLTVRENLISQAPATSPDEAVARAIEAFPALGTRLSQVAGTMSGGEQQMLALARAYVTQAQIVLLDEVSMGLAPLVVDAIFAFVERLAAGGCSLLLVEQYVTRALAISDYVYLLNKGEIAFAGEPGELDEERVFESYAGVSAGT